jgi:MSHA pilin protein MshD
MKPLNQPKMERLSSDLYHSHAPRGNAAIPLARSTDKNLPSESGVSLIELIMYIVIVSVAMAGILQVMNANTTFSADPLVKKQARAVAESLLEEIELQSFATIANAAGRQNFNDVMDYDGYATTGVFPANGAAVAVSGLGDYNVAVAVSAVVWGNIPSTSAIQITVTVNNLNASQVVEAIGYRVGY